MNETKHQHMTSPALFQSFSFSSSSHRRWSVLSFFLIVIIHISTMNVFAQEQLGTKLGNYAGINAASLNPAAVANSPYSWDLNLFTAAVFFENNYAYAVNQSWISAAQEDNWSWEEEAADDENVTGGLYNYERSNAKRGLTAQLYLMAPSIRISKGNWTFGLLTQAKAFASTRSVANGFSYFEYDGRPLQTSFDQEKFKAAYASYASVGIHLGNRIFESTNEEIHVGINANYLLPISAAYFQLNEATTITKTEGGISLSQLDADFGYTGDGTEGGITEKSGGYGFSGDLGLQYIKGINGEGQYDFRFGVSLIDVGFIKYATAVDHSITTDGAIDILSDNYDGVEEASEFAAVLSRESLGDPTASTSGNSFSLFTPAALSVSLDYRLSKRFFVSGMALRRVPVLGTDLARPNLWVVAPRFESKWLELQLPISLMNDRDLRAGLSLRMGFLTVGSEDLGSFMGGRNLNSTDLYVSVKLHPLSLGRDKYRNRGLKAGSVDCPRMRL